MSHPLEEAVYVYSTDGCQGGWLQDAAHSSLLHPYGQDGGAAAAQGHGHRIETVERMAGAEVSQTTAKAPLRACYQVLYSLFNRLRDRNPAPKCVRQFRTIFPTSAEMSRSLREKTMQRRAWLPKSVDSTYTTANIRPCE